MAPFAYLEYGAAHRRRAFYFVLTALVFAVGGTAARAEDQSQALGEIVVTANKFGSEIDKAPVAALSITPTELEAQGIEVTNDIALRVPGMVYDPTGNFAEVFIRGIGSNFALAGLESSVATFVDGVYLQRQNGAVMDLVDLKSVTILKGPQGTLYGRNATGGAVVLETADPTNTFGGFVVGEYGNLNEHRIEGAINIPLTDTLAIRIAGQNKRIGDYLYDPSYNGDRGGSESDYLRLKVRWAPTDQFTAIYGIETYHIRSTEFSQHETVGAPNCIVCAIYGIPNPAFGQGFYSVTQSPDAFDNARFVQQTLGLAYTTDDFYVHSVTGYRVAGTPLRDDQEGMGPDFFTANVNEHGPTLTNDSYVRTSFKFPLNGLVGVSYERERDNQDVSYDGAFPAALGGGYDLATGQRPHNFNEVKINSYSAYTELNYDFGGGVKLTAGARYNADTKDIDVTNNAIYVAEGFSPYPSFSVHTKNDYVTPKVVLSWDAGEYGYFYLAFNRGEKDGGFGAPVGNPGPAVRPEVLNNYDFGAKNSFFGGRLTTDLDIFDGVYKDIQVEVVDSKTATVLLQNAASGHVRGVDFDVRFKATDSFDVSSGVEYLNAEYSNYAAANVFSPGPTPQTPTCPAAAAGLSSCVENLSNTPLPRSPKWSGYLSGDYNQALPGGWSSRLSGIAHATGGYDFLAGGGGPLGVDRQAGYTKINASLTFFTPSKSTEVGLYVDNLTEAHIKNFAQDSAFGDFYVPGIPRTYGVRLRQKF